MDENQSLSLSGYIPDENGLQALAQVFHYLAVNAKSLEPEITEEVTYTIKPEIAFTPISKQFRIEISRTKKKTIKVRFER